jgi:hypothetical protein
VAELFQAGLFFLIAEKSRLVDGNALAPCSSGGKTQIMNGSLAG